MNLMTKKEIVISWVVSLIGLGVGFGLNQMGIYKIEGNGMIIHPLSMMFTFSALFYWSIFSMRFEELVKTRSQIKNMITPLIMTVLSFKGDDWFPNKIDPKWELIIVLLFVVLSIKSIATGGYRKE